MSFKPKYAYRKNVQDLVDYDYLNKLPQAQKNWLDIFTREYYGNERFNKQVQVHQAKHIKSLDDSNNARNRDIYAINKCVDKIDSIEDVYEDRLQGSFYEDSDDSFDTKANAVEDLFDEFTTYFIECNNEAICRRMMQQFVVRFNRIKRLKDYES